MRKTLSEYCEDERPHLAEVFIANQNELFTRFSAVKNLNILMW